MDDANLQRSEEKIAVELTAEERAMVALVLARLQQKARPSSPTR